MRKALFVILAVLLVWSTPGWSLTELPGAAETRSDAEFVPGQVLMKVGPGASVEQIARSVDGRVVRGIGDGSIVLLEVGEGEVEAAVRSLRGRANIVFAEPNRLRHPHAPGDPDFGLKWDLHNDGSLSDGSDQSTADADTDWLEAYNALGADFAGTAIIAVIDTGIDAAHPDLDDKLGSGYDYLDGDGNPHDTYGHGTHVAGIALAETDNAAGTVGMGYGGAITVMPLRVCDSGGCPTSAIVDAIYHAADNGANVINLSLGGRFGSSSEEQAIDYAWNKGLVIAASSGNDGSGKVSYPAAFANAIAVGATDWHDDLAPYSNKGSALDLVAPGGDMSKYHDPGGVYSTMPTYPVYLTTNYSYSEDYDQLQGTSMAAPQVSGLAALLFAANGALTNDEVRSLLEGTADDLGKSGWDREFGWGRINADAAVASATGSSGSTDDPPSVAVTDPQDGSTVKGTITVLAEASDDNGVDFVEFFVNDNALGTDSDGSDGWSVSWDTTTVSDGSHNLTATAVDTAGQSASDTIGVTVDNVADSEVAVSSITPDIIAAGSTESVEIAGSGFAAGADVSLENGSGPAPGVSNVTVVDSTTITATLTVKSGGPPRDRVWDVRVTNPDGSTGVLTDGLTITP